MPFTDRQIAALRPKAVRYEVAEPGRTGLAVRVSPDGEKVWTFRYRWNGRQKRMLLGPCRKMGPAKARIALAEAKDKLQAGIDPGAAVAEERRAARTAPTVDQLVVEYLERHARPNMKPASAAEDDRLLNREVLPEWRRRKAADITRRDVIELLDGIADRGAPVVRNRVAGVLSRLFNVGIERGLVAASPAAGVRRLPETPRETFLSVDQVRAFWHGVGTIDASPAVKVALRFVLLTGQRRGEVAGAARAEIDDTGLWRLPAARAKNGRDNLIPLPPLGLQLVAEADACRVRKMPTRPNRRDRRRYDPTPSPWLFPSRVGDGPVDGAALTHAVARHRDALGIGEATVHDLRRTFATWHAELGTPPDILAALLNHTPTTITARVYDRSSNLAARERAMATWCEWLARVVGGEAIAENVVTLRTARPA